MAAGAVLLGRAQAAIYRWPAEFSGFTADIVLRDGVQELAGTLTVSAGEQQVALEGAADEQRAWVTQQLNSMIAHRRTRHVDEGEPVVAEEAGEHPLGVLIKAGDSTYRVRGDWITEITRNLPMVTVRVYVTRREPAPDGRFLPAQVASTLSDPASGAITRMELMEERFTEVGGLMLPASRSVVTQTPQGVRARIIDFSAYGEARA